MLAPMSDESRDWFRRLGRNVLSKMILSAAAAVGAKLGERLVEALFDEDTDDGPEEPQS